MRSLICTLTQYFSASLTEPQHCVHTIKMHYKFNLWDFKDTSLVYKKYIGIKCINVFVAWNKGICHYARSSFWSVPTSSHCPVIMTFWTLCSLAGVSRSVTLVVAYLMTVTSLGWDEALAAVKVARPCASPNMGFQNQLQEFESSQLQQVTPPRFMTGIAWRYLHKLSFGWDALLENLESERAKKSKYWENHL